MIAPANLRRLDLLAAIAERQVAETMARQAAAVRGAVQQDALLSAYRARLAANWQSGAAVPAAAALRAARFAAGAENAATQIEQGRLAAAAKSEQASLELSRLRARRRYLADLLAGAARAAEAEAMLREELARAPLQKRRFGANIFNLD